MGKEVEDESKLYEHSKAWFEMYWATDLQACGSSLMEQRRYFEVLATLRSSVAWKTWLTVCDVGCGDGTFLQKLAEACGMATVTGIDFSETALQKARMRLPSGTFSLLDFRSVDWGQLSQFDLVLCMEVLGAFDTYQLQVLASVKGLVKDGGYLLISQRATSDWPVQFAKYQCQGFVIQSTKMFAADVITTGCPGYIILLKKEKTI